MQGEGLMITFDTVSDATRLGSAHKAGGEKESRVVIKIWLERGVVSPAHCARLLCLLKLGVEDNPGEVLCSEARIHIPLVLPRVWAINEAEVRG